MEMGGLDPVWTGHHCGHCNWHDDTHCAGLTGGVVVQNKPEFWYRLLVISFLVGFVLGYGVAVYVAVMLER